MINPFSIFGLTPALLKGLRKDQVLILLKSQYKALSLIHHPDRGGKEAQFKRISDAWRRLDPDQNPEGLEFYLKDYMKLRGRVREDVQSRAEDIDRSIAALEDRYFTLWAAQAMPPPEVDRASVFHLAGWRILLSDLVRSMLRGLAPPPVKNPLDAYELEFHATETRRYELVERPLEGVDIASLPSGWVRLQAAKRRQSYWGRRGSMVTFAPRILGTLPSAKSLFEAPPGDRGRPLLIGNAERDLVSAISEGISVEALRAYCPEISPYLNKHAVVLGLVKDRVHILGRIIAMSDPRDRQSE